MSTAKTGILVSTEPNTLNIQDPHALGSSVHINPRMSHSESGLTVSSDLSSVPSSPFTKSESSNQTQKEKPDQSFFPPEYKQNPYSGDHGEPEVCYGGAPPMYHNSSDDAYYYKADDDKTPITEDWQGFSEKAIRQAFIRKVYGILLTQLAFTVAVVALFVFEPHVKLFVQTCFPLYIASYVTFIVVYIVLICCSSIRRQWPTNAILLGIFTIVMSYLVAAISSFHSTHVVLLALGIAASCCLGITLFSFNTKYDFTSMAGILFILCWILFMFGFVAIFTYSRIMETVYAVLGALLFMLFLAFDTQLLLGNKEYRLNPEEHIFAALQLYLDVIYVFLYILSIVSGAGYRK